MNTGIYVITNTINSKKYVGSTKNFSARFKSHLYSLKRGTHHSQKLQRAWDRYGETAFKFERVLVCSVENLLMYEQILIDALDAAKSGYNQLVKAGSREGTPHDSDTVRRMRAFQRSYRKKYEWDGQMLCISEIAELVGLPRDTLWRRVVADKIPLEKAVRTPYKKPGQKLPGFGVERTFYEWVAHIGCTESFLRRWLSKGLSVEDCVAKHKHITISELARSLGVDGKLFNARVLNGWSIGDALMIPKIAKGGHHHIPRVAK